MAHLENFVLKLHGAYFSTKGRSIDPHSTLTYSFVNAAYSILASAYMKPPLIPTPKIPRTFLEQKERYRKSATSFASAEDIMNLQCDLGEIKSRTLIHCARPHGNPGDEADVAATKILYTQLLD